ncbi:MAG: FAD:protein FMN transferase [Clostridia bacterium]|nr:FAD:protein FMN transferase [Clostridia bacterium]
MVLKKVTAIVLSLMTLLLCSCREYDFYSKATYSTADIFAMDTIITVRLAGEVEESVFDECEKIIKDIEALLSKTVAKSEVARLNAAKADEAVSMPASSELIRLALEVSEKTDGAFDITLEPLTRLWDVTEKGFTPPDEESIADALSHIGADKLVFDGDTVKKTDACAGIDLGGIGKGMAAQAVCEHLESLGYIGTVSFGGNIGTVSQKSDGEPFVIAIKSPFDTSKMIGTLKLDRGFVAVSAAYERYAEIDGVKYHHIIDPETGRPSDSDIASAVAISKNGALADALSTALFVMGSERAIELYGQNAFDFEAVIIKNNGEIILTDGLENGSFAPING